MNPIERRAQLCERKTQMRCLFCAELTIVGLETYQAVTGDQMERALKTRPNTTTDLPVCEPCVAAIAAAVFRVCEIAPGAVARYSVAGEEAARKLVLEERLEKVKAHT